MSCALCRVLDSCFVSDVFATFFPLCPNPHRHQAAPPGQCKGAPHPGGIAPAHRCDSNSAMLSWPAALCSAERDKANARQEAGGTVAEEERSRQGPPACAVVPAARARSHRPFTVPREEECVHVVRNRAPGQLIARCLRCALHTGVVFFGPALRCSARYACRCVLCVQDAARTFLRKQHARRTHAATMMQAVIRGRRVRIRDLVTAIAHR